MNSELNFEFWILEFFIFGFESKFWNLSFSKQGITWSKKDTQLNIHLLNKKLREPQNLRKLYQSKSVWLFFSHYSINFSIFGFFEFWFQLLKVFSFQKKRTPENHEFSNFCTFWNLHFLAIAFRNRVTLLDLLFLNMDTEILVCENIKDFSTLPNLVTLTKKTRMTAIRKCWVSLPRSVQ